MLAVNPGEIIQRLDNFVVEDEGAIGIVPEGAQSEVKGISSNQRNAPTLRIGGRKRKPQFLHNISLPAQLLRAIVGESNVAEAELVHLARRQNSGIGNHVLSGVGVEGETALRQR